MKLFAEPLWMVGFVLSVYEVDAIVAKEIGLVSEFIVNKCWGLTDEMGKLPVWSFLEYF